jgi:hypothetical protein
MTATDYKAIFRRARREEEAEEGYTKDLLQAPSAIQRAVREMLHGEPPYEPLTYRWPGGEFQGGKISPGSDRFRVGQWTQAGAPAPWRIGDPSKDPLVTLEGDPDASIPDDANAQWEVLRQAKPWLVMVQLDGSQSDFHLRAYLGAPPPHLSKADIGRVPEELRLQMYEKGGLAAGNGLPDLWFDPDDLRDPWRTDADEGAEEAAEAAVPGEPRDAPDDSRPLGAEYVPEDETATSAAPEPFAVDPDERDRGTQAHKATQNRIAEAVRERGFKPRRPVSGEPNYDIAWEGGDVLVVAEVKSVTPKNSEKQLRLALGQILRYRDRLEEGGRKVRSVIALSAAPHDERWTALCGRYDVGLIWRPDLGEMLDSWLDRDPSN